MLNLPTFLQSSPAVAPAPLVLRPLLPGDGHALTGLELSSYSRHPWSPRDVRAAAGTTGVVVVVAARAGIVVGYLVYARGSTVVDVLRLAVWPSRRRRGVGRALLGRVAAATDGRRAECVVSELWVPGQLALRACGWRATRLLKRAGDDGEDQIRFCLRPDDGCRGK